MLRRLGADDFPLRSRLISGSQNMTTNIAHNKALVRHFFAAIEKGDLSVFDDIVAEDYNDHLTGQQRGRSNCVR